MIFADYSTILMTEDFKCKSSLWNRQARGRRGTLMEKRFSAIADKKGLIVIALKDPTHSPSQRGL
jgi:hypothetical protein